MPHPLSGQVVWITGASSGIGAALAQALAQHGARLILSARRGDVLQELKQTLSMLPSSAYVLPLDVTDFTSHPAKVAEAIDVFGHIDIMIHNAGVSQRSYVTDTTLETYRQLMDVDYFGPVSLTKLLLPHMTAAKHGHFVVISSVAGKVGTIMRSGYCGAKFAVIGFFDSLRAEHHRDNLRVTTICPGFINTAISQNALTGDGASYNRIEKNATRGLSADICAARIIDAIVHNKNEVVIGGAKESMAVYLRRFFPDVLFRMMPNNPPQ